MSRCANWSLTVVAPGTLDQQPAEARQAIARVRDRIKEVVELRAAEPKTSGFSWAWAVWRAAVHPAGPEPMTMTLRMPVPYTDVTPPAWRRSRRSGPRCGS
ncbi:hypothetical protein GCM10010313_76350 [Streptomyces violarus]|nr:hypothetical protein GCM10010313_76350 [Streptomyces violarus]